jgi:hypothetical protein
MRNRAAHLGRRFFSLALAYLLALQVILTAWTVLIPAVGGIASAHGIICVTQPDGYAPASDGPLTPCPCGPLCHAGAAPMLGLAPQTISVAIAHVPPSSVVWPVQQFDPARNNSAHPGKARAPPAVV